MKQHSTVEVYLHAFLTSATDGNDWSASSPDHCSPTGCEAEWGRRGGGGQSERERGKKNAAWPLQKSNTDFSVVQPVVEFLYRLSYRGSSSPTFHYEQTNLSRDSCCRTNIPTASGSNARKESLASLSAYQLFSLPVITEQRMWKCLWLTADNKRTAVIGRLIHKQQNGGRRGLQRPVHEHNNYGRTD
jgi:hypothetical protein